MKKVLIVEDCKITRALLRRIVKQEGHASIEASNGRRALSILSDNRDIDLIITDMMMPEVSGKDLILTVRSDQEIKDTPIIVISGVVSLSEITEILERGASRFLAKPFDVNDMKGYMKILLDQPLKEEEAERLN